MSTTVKKYPSAHSLILLFCSQILASVLSLSASNLQAARVNQDDLRNEIIEGDTVTNPEFPLCAEDALTQKLSLGDNVIRPQQEEDVIEHGRTFLTSVQLRLPNGRCRPVYARVIRLNRLQHIEIVQKIKEHCKTLNLDELKKHPHIAVVHGFYESRDFYSMPMIIVDKYSFNICTYRKHLQDTQNEGLENITKKLLRQAAKALEFLHGHGRDLVHGNVQGNNLLVDTPEDKPVVLKLSDVGLARDLTLEGENPNLSWRWRPAEDYLKDAPLEHNKYIDRYSFGMTVYEVYSGNVPFHSHKGRHAILRERPEIERPKSVSTDVWNIHIKCKTCKSGDYPMEKVTKDFDKLFPK